MQDFQVQLTVDVRLNISSGRFRVKASVKETGVFLVDVDVPQDLQLQARALFESGIAHGLEAEFSRLAMEADKNART